MPLFVNVFLTWNCTRYDLLFVDICTSPASRFSWAILGNFYNDGWDGGTTTCSACNRITTCIMYVLHLVSTVTDGNYQTKIQWKIWLAIRRSSPWRHYLDHSTKYHTFVQRKQLQEFFCHGCVRNMAPLRHCLWFWWLCDNIINGTNNFMRSHL